MEISKLIRNPEKVHESLVELDNGKLVTKKNVRIYIPVRFAERGLASIGIDTYIVGIYAITVDDKYYGISLVNAMIKIEPTSTMKVMINNESYYEFTFEPGSTVMSSVNLVKNNKLIYKIYDEIIAKGRIPWYVNYMDLGKLFDTARYHAGANVGGNHEVTEMLASLISRDSRDRHKYYRQTIEDINDILRKPPSFIPLRSVTYSATNTTNKLAGSYFNTGLVSALVSPSSREERIESLLRR